MFEKQWNSPRAEENGLSSVTVGIQHPPKKPKLPKPLKNVATRHDFTPQAPVTEEAYTKAGKGVVPADTKV